MTELWQTWDVELAYTAADLLNPAQPAAVPVGGEPIWGIPGQPRQQRARNPRAAQHRDGMAVRRIRHRP